MPNKTKTELMAEIERLNAIIEKRDREFERLKALETRMNEILSEKYWAPIQNERGAGRKPKLTDGTKEKIRGLRERGMTYAQIAAETGLSVGFVHKTYHSLLDSQIPWLQRGD